MAVFMSREMTIEKAEIITFYMGGSIYAYNAEEGMTWAEFVASEYNTGGFSVDGNHIIYDNCVVGEGSYINAPSDTIKNEYVYTLHI